MRVEGLLLHAAELLREFRESGDAADRMTAIFFRMRRELGAHERRFITESFYHVVRNLRRIDEAILSAFTGLTITRKCEKAGFPVMSQYGSVVWQRKPGDRPMRWGQAAPEIIWIDSARIALASIERDGENSGELLMALAHAWDGLPEFARGRVAGPTAQRLLERALELMHHFVNDLEPLDAARAYSFPDWMWARLGYGLPFSETLDLAASLSRRAPLTLRVNTLKCTVEQARAALDEHKIVHRAARWSPTALQLDEHRFAAKIPGYHEGWFEFQDEASQLCSLMASPAPGSTVIDACAGGGGKSLHLAALMENRGRVLAHDADSGRMRDLKRRRVRSNANIIEILEFEGDTPPASARADTVLIDAPCTGTGTLRRNPDLRWRLSQSQLVDVCAVQSMLLDRWCECVAPGGVLVYATCSLMNEENGAQIAAFLERHPEFKRDVEGARAAFGEKATDVLDRRGDLVLYPFRHECDGFYTARLRRL